MKVVVAGVEREFPMLGSMVLLDATKEIRRVRQDAFLVAGSSICGTGDPTTTVGQIWTALNQYMNSMVVNDAALRSWLWSYEGAFFLIEKSLKKFNKKLTREEYEQIIDSMTSEQIASVGQELLFSLLPEERVAIGEPVDSNSNESTGLGAVDE